jgi:hypothetical protein
MNRLIWLRGTDEALARIAFVYRRNADFELVYSTRDRQSYPQAGDLSDSLVHFTMLIYMGLSD